MKYIATVVHSRATMPAIAGFAVAGVASAKVSAAVLCIVAVVAFAAVMTVRRKLD